jgi:hypothetical protein
VSERLSVHILTLTVHGPCDLLKLMQSINETPIDVEHSRQRVQLIGRLASARYTLCLPAVYAGAPFYYLLGALYVHFRWEPLTLVTAQARYVATPLLCVCVCVCVCVCACVCFHGRAHKWLTHGQRA